MSRIIRHPEPPKKGWMRCYTCERGITASEARLAALAPNVELELCNVCDGILHRFSEIAQKVAKGQA